MFLTILVFMAFLALGVNVLRFLISAIVIAYRRKHADKPVGLLFITFNFLETLAIVAGYVILMAAYYAR